MAATRLIAIHGGKGGGKGGGGAKGNIDYIEDDEKTEEGKWITAYECDPVTAAEEFDLSMREYIQKIGDKASDNVMAYQIRQSFKPGEITPEEANRIGYETAMRFTKGEHAFVVATHTNTAHIHNHIIYNAVNLDCDRKFRDFHRSGIALGRLSNLICLENGYSVIADEPYHSDKVYNNFHKDRTVRDGVREAIDRALANKPKTFEGFLQEMQSQGYAIKRGKNIAVKGKGQERFVRLKSLGKGYTEEDIRKKIDGVAKEAEQKKESAPTIHDNNLEKVLNIQDIIAKGKGPGYERWAKTFNAKKICKALLFIEEKGIRSYDELVDRTKATSERFGELLKDIKSYEARLSEISSLRKHIINYSKTKAVYDQYRQSGFDRKFFEEHRADIMLYKKTKDAFKEYPNKLPSVKSLNEEYKKVLEKKNAAYAEYKQVKADMQQFQIAKYDIDSALGIRETPAPSHSHQRSR
ncbi:relaxase [Butyrivibrio sp. CB08]|uniref:relaxase/mobilization nuclease domain-containing protein n=1 Tax=Butyrivibrio sp. CB08 TaxID=2364879 RepID=UPI000EA982EC|nr:relaxase/mobilization nuclease domain-containing protein [Butyrivibrio sp. CB08]RKM60586.1 relaxase [Butyrivibrio sp. CB08]